MKLKVAFMGTPEFAIPGLKTIYKNFNLICCYTQPSRPSGRGQKISHSSVKNFCIENNISVFTPENFKDKSEIDRLKKINYDVLVVAAYGIILPKDVLRIPRFGALNIHASLLPRYRGAAPIQRAILAGDKKTGITIIQMNEKLDAGEIILQKEIEIKEKHTAEEIHDKLANIGGKLINDVLKKIEKKGQIKSTPQDETKVTYAQKIKTEETKINWNKSGKDILRQIKAFGGWLIINKQRIKIFDADISSMKNKFPGLIVDKNFSISCGNGDIIKPTILQKSGATKMDIHTFLRGFHFEINQKVE
jgi:methionyl-tRNA formyltransferase